MTTTRSEVLDRFERALRSVARRLYGPPRRGAHPWMVTAEPSCPDRTAYVLLSELDHGGAQRVSDLAGSLGVDVSTASRQLHELVASGLVRRKPDPEDGRAALLELTRSGAAELAAAREARHQVLDRAMATLDDDERRELLSAFERLARVLESQAHARRATTDTALRVGTGASK